MQLTGQQIDSITLAVRTILQANPGVNIGDVNIATIPALPGTAAEGAALPTLFVVVAGDDGTDTYPLQIDPVTGGLRTIGAANPGVAIGDVVVTTIPGIDILTIAAGENHIGEVGANTIYKEVTLTLDTNAYAQNDVLADTQEITNAVRISGGTGIIQSITVLDQDDNGSDIDIVFLRSNVSLGTENDPITISAANADEILHTEHITANDFVDYINSQQASITNISYVFQAVGTSLFVAAVFRDTVGATYTAAGITLKIGILAD